MIPNEQQVFDLDSRVGEESYFCGCGGLLLFDPENGVFLNKKTCTVTCWICGEVHDLLYLLCNKEIQDKLIWEQTEPMNT
jgi:hypothetical protein